MRSSRCCWTRGKSQRLGSSNNFITASRSDSAFDSIAHHNSRGIRLSLASSLWARRVRTMARASFAGRRRAVLANWLRTSRYRTDWPGRWRPADPEVSPTAHHYTRRETRCSGLKNSDSRRSTCNSPSRFRRTRPLSVVKKPLCFNFSSGGAKREEIGFEIAVEIRA